MRLERYQCERCREEFTRAPKRAGYRFCSQKCANVSRRKIDFDAVKRLAMLGLRLAEVGKLTGLHARTVRKVIDDLGIYREWAQQRYLKCRSANG